MPRNGISRSVYGLQYWRIKNEEDFEQERSYKKQKVNSWLVCALFFCLYIANTVVWKSWLCMTCLTAVSHMSSVGKRCPNCSIYSSWRVTALSLPHWSKFKRQLRDQNYNWPDGNSEAIWKFNSCHIFHMNLAWWKRCFCCFLSLALLLSKQNLLQ